MTLRYLKFGPLLFNIGIQRILACAGAAGVAPVVLCSFPGGRLETLLVNCRTWGCRDLRDPLKLESMVSRLVRKGRFNLEVTLVLLFDILCKLVYRKQR